MMMMPAARPFICSLVCSLAHSLSERHEERAHNAHVSKRSETRNDEQPPPLTILVATQKPAAGRSVLGPRKDAADNA